MKKLDIYFYEVFEEEKELFLKYLPNNIEADFSSKTIQTSGHRCPPSEIISIRTQSIFNKQWEPDLRAIITRSTGYNHLLNLSKDIKIGYLPLYCNRSVAEHALMLWMCLLKKVKRQVDHFKTFNRDGITGLECLGKNLLVVGVGNIGSEICKIGLGLGMNVKGVDISKKYDFIEYISLKSGMMWADIIVCAMNLTNENRWYFTKDIFRISEKKQIFINISRGEFVSSKILLEAIEEGYLYGVGIDVYNNEPSIFSALTTSGYSDDEIEIESVRKLMERDDCILTPHNAFNTEESTHRKVQQTIEQLIRYIETGEFMWQVSNRTF